MHSAHQKIKLLSIQEAARFLGISKSTLRIWDKQGILPSLRTAGGQRRYAKQELEAFLKNANKNYINKENNISKDIDPVINISSPPLRKEHLSPYTLLKKQPLFSLIKEVSLFPLPIYAWKMPNILSDSTKHINNLFSSFFSPRMLFIALSSIIGSGAIVGSTVFFADTHINFLSHQKAQQTVLAAKDDHNKSKQSVLQAATGNNRSRIGNLSINILSFFNAPVNFKEPVTLDKDITINGDFTFKGKKLDLGTGSLSAPNVIYSITAGDGTSVSSGQNPTIKNTGVLSLGGSVGALSLTAGDGITIDGLKITNSLTTPSTFKTVAITGSSSFDAGSSTDTLTFTAGTGITLTPDTSNKKVTIAAGGITAAAGWTDDGTTIRLTTAADNVGIGTTSPASKLEVSGTAQLKGSSSTTGLLVSSEGNVGIGTTTPSSFNLQIAGNLGPDIDATYDLGSASKQFANIYGQQLTLSGNLVVGGNFQSSGSQSGFWQRNGQALSSLNITDDILLGASSTSSALIKLTGTANNHSWINTGNVGIGTTNPTNFKLEVVGNIGPTTGSAYDFGSSARRWATIYGDTGNFTNLSSSTTSIAGTTASDFLINTDNGTADTEDATLTFERGAPAVNVQFKWNSSTKQLSTNTPSFIIEGDSGIAFSGTAALIVNQIQNQDIFTASSSGNTRFIIDNNGNVGINTTTTLAALDVRGFNSTTPTASVSANSNFAGLVVDNRGNGDLFTASSSGLNRFVITQNGNVGIGKNNPTSTLDVTGNAAISGSLTVNGNLITTGSSGSQGWWQRASGTVAPLNITDDLVLGASATSSALIKLTGTASSDSWINTGNVGIGTTAPSSKLDVNGNLTLSSLSSSIKAVDSSTTNKLGNNRYLYSKPVTITNSSASTLPQNATYTLIITGADASTIYSQSQGDADDVRIGYSDTEISRVIDIFTSSSIYIRFAIQANITAGGNNANYDIYWGNSSVSSPTAYSGSTNLDDANDSSLWTASASSVQLSTDTSTFTQSTGSTLFFPAAADILTFSTTNQAQLPITLGSGGGGAVTISGTTYVYAIGGSNNTGSSPYYRSTAYKATLDGSANVTTFDTTSQAQLAEKLMNHGVNIVTISGTTYVYVLGGYSTEVSLSNYRSTAYKATVTNGNLGAFSATTALPDKRSSFPPLSATVDGTSYVYLLGGYSNGNATSSVHKSTINASTGALSSWTSLGSLLPTTMTSHGAATATIGGTTYVYLFNSSAVYKATIASGGGIGAFSTTSQPQLPQTISEPMPITATIGGTTYLYVLGGSNKSTVYKATINTSGDISTAFATTSQAQLPANVSSGIVTTAVTGGTTYVYVIGGSSTGGSNISTVYKAQITEAAGSGVTVTKTLSQALNLSNINMITFWLQSGDTNVGSKAVFEFYDATADAWNTFSGITLSQASTWEQQYYDISGIANGNKSNVTQIRFRMTSDLAGPFTVDLIRAESQLFSGTTSSVLGDTTNFSNNIYMNSEALGTVGVNYNSGSTGGFTVYDGATTALLNVLDNGNVGIGSASAAFKFDVQDTQATNYVAQIYNADTSNTADGLLINLGVANASRGTGNYFVGFAGKGIVAGKIQGGSSAVAYTTTAADYAEYFLVASESARPEKGDIVMLDSTKAKAVKKAASSGSPIGVVSTNPGFIGNGPLCEINDEDCETNYEKTNVLVGITGQILVNVSTVNGAINIGDPIAASSLPGVGVKAKQKGYIVGKALESFDSTTCITSTTGTTGSETIYPHDTRPPLEASAKWGDTRGTRDTSCIGEILVLVQPGWHDPSIFIAQDGTLTMNHESGIMNQDVVSSVTASSSASISEIASSSATLNLNEDPAFVEIMKQMETLSSRLDSLQTILVGTDSGSLTESGSGVILNSFQDLEILNQVQNDVILGVSSTSATLSDQLASLPEVSLSGNLTVNGRTTLNDLGITGTITTGSLSIDGNDNTINTLGGNLKLQPLALGGVDILNGKVTIDTRGNMALRESLTAKSITTQKLQIDTSTDAIASKGAILSTSIGTATIKAGQTTVEITTTQLTPKSLIFITPEEPVSIASKHKTGTTFTITISSPRSQDLKVNWWIVN